MLPYGIHATVFILCRLFFGLNVENPSDIEQITTGV